MRSPEIYWGMLKNIVTQPEISFHEDVEIDWGIIEQRRQLFGKLYECFTYACLIRDFLERDLQKDPTTIHFKAVEDRRNLWHLWVELEGEIVDVHKFRKKYRYIYPLGRGSETYERLYHQYKQNGEFNWD